MWRHGVLLLAAACGGSGAADPIFDLPDADGAPVADAAMSPQIDATDPDAGVGAPDFPDAAPEPTGGAALPAVKYGPYLQGPGRHQVTVSLETSTAVPVSVELDGRTLASPAGTHHELTFDGLAPARRYWYRAHVGGTAGVVHHATTLPLAGEPVRFVVMGDHQFDTLALRDIVDRVAAEGVDLIVQTGDIVFSGGDESSWEEVVPLLEPLLADVSMVSVAGNHEYYDGGVSRFTQLMTAPPGSALVPDLVYSFDAGSVHLVVLDSNAETPGLATWLQADLFAARAAGAERVFVFVHHGPHSCGPHGGDAALASLLAGVAQVTPIDAVFSGHDHIYERGLTAAGLRYFVSGGGGADLYWCTALSTTKKCVVDFHYLVVSVTGGTVRVQAKPPSGTVIDDVSF